MCEGSAKKSGQVIEEKRSPCRKWLVWDICN